MNRLPQIKLNRLLIVFGLVFIAADTYPDPQLGPGLIQGTMSAITQTGKTAAQSIFARSPQEEPRPASGLAQAKSRYYGNDM